MSAKTVLILGATGGIGASVARLLSDRNWTVRAMHRAPDAARASSLYEWVRGDALNQDDVRIAAKGASVIVHAVKPRDYRDWHKQVLPMIDATIAAANGARIVMPGNVYNYGPDAGLMIAEDAIQHPPTAKGRLRVEMERRLAMAVEDGRATGLIVRAGDFFGPGAGSSWFSEAMVRPGRRPRVVRNPGTQGVGHQWTYLPDLAETMVRLIEHEELPPFARFHMDGHWDATGQAMAEAIVRVLGEPEVAVRPLPWWLIVLAAPFMPGMRELAELRYLWRRPVRLDNRLLLQTLGIEPHTTLDAAVRTTLQGLSM